MVCTLFAISLSPGQGYQDSGAIRVKSSKITCRAMNPVVRGDIVVSDFLNSIGGYRHKERRDKLLDILDVDLDWHMHAISDGERRRVQLVMGLMGEWDVLLLDEVCDILGTLFTGTLRLYSRRYLLLSLLPRSL